MEKLADLVCTREIFLYKSGQVSNKYAIRLLARLLVTVLLNLDEYEQNYVHVVRSGQ